MDISNVNPQDSLSPAIPVQTPQIYSGRTLPHHPYQIYYVANHSEDTANSFEGNYLHDTVDIIVRAGVNALGDTCSGVHALGYGVDPLTTGGSIGYRKMFEMHGNMDLSRDSLKHCLTFAGPPDGPSSMTGHERKYYVVTNCGDSIPQSNYGISNIKENCWSTKIDSAGTAMATNIAQAKYPDGYYITTIVAYSQSHNIAEVKDTILVDNFDPKVKYVFPANEFGFVPTNQKTVFCTFSETMDTTTVKAANIRVVGLKSSTQYTIDTIRYQNDTLVLKVNSGFKFLELCSGLLV